MSDRLQVSADKLTEGLDRLNEADELLKKMDAQLKDVEGKSADSLRKTTKAMQDSVKNIRESISGKRSERQGYGQLPQMTVMNSYFNARGAIDAKNIAPGAAEETAVKYAEGRIAESVSRINRFFDGPWKQYRALAENTKLDLFKEYSPIK